MADGIRNPNLEDSGVCGVDGVRQHELAAKAPPDVQELPNAKDLRSHGWDLRTGFLLSQGTPARHYWLVYYYCAGGETTARGQKVYPGDIELHGVLLD